MSVWGELKAAIFGPPQTLMQAGSERGWLMRAIGGGKTKAGVPVSEWSARQLPIVYACVNRIANPIAYFPLGIFQSTDAGGSTKVTQHPMSERLGLRPNDFMSSRTLRKTVQAHALLWGNGYCEIERNNAGQAVGLWPLLPDRTRPVRVGDDLVYRTTVSGQQNDIDQDDVIHIMDQSHDGYVGQSQIWLARQALGMSFAMEEFGAKFFANDAKSGGFLLHPGKLSSTARGNLGNTGPDGRPAPGRTDPGADLDRQGGLDNAHRVKVLEEGMKYVATTIPPEDAQFLGTREFQIAEICRIYDVPLVLVQSHEKTTSWGSGIEQLMIGFVQQTISPWIGGWEEELNWKLFTAAERARGLYVKFNVNALLRGDMAARAAFYTAVFGVGGISPNQIAALEDWDPVGPEGDNRFVPSNFETLKQAAEPKPVVAPPALPIPVVEKDAA